MNVSLGSGGHGGYDGNCGGGNGSSNGDSGIVVGDNGGCRNDDSGNYDVGNRGASIAVVALIAQFCDATITAAAAVLYVY